MRRRILSETNSNVTLTLTKTSTSASTSYGTYTFQVKANDVLLTDENVIVTDDSSWISNVSWTSNTSTVSFYVSSTDSTASRTGTITVTYKGASVTHTVTQAGGSLSIGGYSALFSSSSGDSLGFTIKINGNSGSGSYTVTSKPSWLNVSVSGSSLTMSTNSSNSSTSYRSGTITISQNGQTASKSVYQLAGSYNTIDGHAYVTVGGKKWSPYNIGANTPFDEGLYFAWGDTTGYTRSQVGPASSGKQPFNNTSYKYNDGTSNWNPTKYNSSDGKTTLDSSDDAAIANWGGGWRIPTTSDSYGSTVVVNFKNTNLTSDILTGCLCYDSSNGQAFLIGSYYFYNGYTSTRYNYEGAVWRKSCRSGNNYVYAYFMKQESGRLKSASSGYAVRTGGCPIRPIHD